MSPACHPLELCSSNTCSTPGGAVDEILEASAQVRRRLFLAPQGQPAQAGHPSFRILLEQDAFARI
jgi:hypothetical protein